MAFKKGPDKNRHMNGRKAKGAVELSQAMSRAISEEGLKGERFRKMIVKVWDLAERGVPWAVQFIADRTMGKVKEHVELSTPAEGKMLIEVVRVEG
jgi:hypothetical protein